MKIFVTETEGLRQMHFGTRWCQGVMRVAEPDRLELEYAVRMSAWLLFHDLAELSRQRLVTLGLGAGALTRFAWRALGMQTTAVEIDEQVIEACETHFLLPREADGLEVVQADAAEFIARPGLAHRFDVIQVDAYDAQVEGPALDSEAFHAHCRAALRDSGTVCVNLVGRNLDVRASVARLRQGLEPRTLWQFPPTPAGNVVVVAHCGAVPAEEALAARAAEIERRWALPALQWMAMARRSG
jgi:spermidine synthase